MIFSLETWLWILIFISGFFYLHNCIMWKIVVRIEEKLKEIEKREHKNENKQVR